MSEDVFFENIIDKATLDNLNLLSADLSLLRERRILELYDIAAAASRTYDKIAELELDAYEIISLLSERVVFDGSVLHNIPLPENIERLNKSLRFDNEQDKTFFADLFCSLREPSDKRFSEEQFLQSRSQGNRFTYVKNSYADEAYDVFSASFDNSVVEYAKDFRSCVRTLLDGGCDYCLLPLEERGGARIAGVLELIYSYDLKIVGVTPVFGQDGALDLKYAMVSRAFLKREYSPDDDRYLEIRLGRERGGLSELLFSAECFGNRLYRVNTLTVRERDSERTYYSVVFHNGESDFLRLLTYLTFFREDFIPVGIYTNLE